MLKVLKPGLYTSIQDAGRRYYLKYGVPVSGAMDHYAATKANLLLNNKPDCAVIECTQSGPELLFTQPTQIAICGADMSVKINDVKTPLNVCLNIKAGDKLSFGKLTYGYRTYIAVKGGFKTNEILGSRSYYDPITHNNIIEKGDEISYTSYSGKLSNSNSSVSIDTDHYTINFIEIFKGPEYEMLNEHQQNYLLSIYFHISINNRMAYQLKELLPNSLPPILSSCVLPGTVQLTPSGKIIILMRDAQTTGGYPRILNLNEASINQLSQKKLSDRFKFELI